ncbi:glycosyl transferase family protein [Aquisediminimonas sediminicola]|uniref:glycosyl transferase family protein n=1 Tax=Alteraquisediminimonas sediminicola TaxID=2676787 RepID=UPI001C8ED918|nr:glycosyl transferase family protein [Aquisediminimonas sediminicola]
MVQATAWFFTFYHELLLACASGIILLGLDDLIVFFVWLVRVTPKAAVLMRMPVERPPIAIFVPAWDESSVIGRMLATLLDRMDYTKYIVFVGCYQNDSGTLSAVQEIAENDARVQLVSGNLDGPTTKAECLNRCWHALCEWEVQHEVQFAAVVLHDAEDVVHRDELNLFSAHLPYADMIQLPVVPFIDISMPWVSGHYADEFALTHGIDMPTRQILGSALPSAGVGCAISRPALARIASGRGGLPFDADSLTEDYELGLRLGELGCRTSFVREISAVTHDLIAVRAYFPSDLASAVRQKSRWILGIALFGWDRLGWHGSMVDRWMRLRDRRALLSAFLLLLSYISLFMSAGVIMFAGAASGTVPPLSPTLQMALGASGAMLAWRLLERAVVVFCGYGLKQALFSIPRALVANMIAMVAARRAFMAYLRYEVRHPVIWDKTSHVFPDDPAI